MVLSAAHRHWHGGSVSKARVAIRALVELCARCDPKLSFPVWDERWRHVEPPILRDVKNAIDAAHTFARASAALDALVTHVQGSVRCVLALHALNHLNSIASALRLGALAADIVERKWLLIISPLRRVLIATHPQVALPRVAVNLDDAATIRAAEE